LIIRKVAPDTTARVQTHAQVAHQILTGERSISSAVLAVIPSSEPMATGRTKALKESDEVGEP
jgi:hypothetical protein